MISTHGEAIRVLLVDDEPDFAALAVELLTDTSERIHAVSTTDPTDALERLSEEAFDCIVADYVMDDLTGIDLLGEVREEFGDLPFIVFTARGSEEVAAEAIATGVTDYVPKGTDTEQFRVLTQRITSAVENYRAQQALAVSQRELERSYERITDGFFSIDDEWRYTFVNERGAEIVDKSVEAMEGRTVWEVFPDLDDTPFGEAFRTAMEEQESTQIEAYYEPHERWYTVSVYPDEEGISIYFRAINERIQFEQTLTALHSVASDLSELDSVEAICERSIEAAEHLLEFDVSLIAIEENGVLQPVAVSSGMEPDDFKPRPITDDIAGLTYRSGEAYLIDDIQNHPEANPTTSLGSGLSVPVGTHGNFQAVDEDVGGFTERDLKLAQLLMSHTADHLDRLEDRRTMEQHIDRLDEFASIVSHDLRNPLSVAMGRLELASNECDTEHHDHIESALHRMEDLIEDLLTLARKGESSIDVDRVNLGQMAETCLESVDMGDATVSITTDQTIMADNHRLQQLLENLYRNAIEHAGSECTIKIGALENGFFIEDDGPGIDPDARDQVFQIGYSTKPDGTGFGLSIVHEIVEVHDWTITVTDAPEGGARFEITGVEIV